MHLKEQRR